MKKNLFHNKIFPLQKPISFIACLSIITAYAVIEACINSGSSYYVCPKYIFFSSAGNAEDINETTSKHVQNNSFSTPETDSSEILLYGWKNGLYETYARLESIWGSYDVWPSYAKEELMPFFVVNSIDELDKILANKYGYGRVDMVTLYSMIVGDYNAVPLFWDEESRIRYSSLLLKYDLTHDGWIDIPRPADLIITPENAITQSQYYIVDIGLSSIEEINHFTYYWSYGRFADQSEACYEIYILTDDDELLLSCYVFPNLSVKEVFDPDTTMEDVWIDEDVISAMHEYSSSHHIPENASFAGWPLYAKEFFSLNIAPVIRRNAYGREDAYSPVDLLAAAQYEYSIPDERSIDLDTAHAIAILELIKTYHLEREVIKEMDVCIFYDVSCPANPIWKFLFSFSNFHVSIDRNIIYKVHVSAYNGVVNYSDSWNYRNDISSWKSMMRRY